MKTNIRFYVKTNIRFYVKTNIRFLREDQYTFLREDQYTFLRENQYTFLREEQYTFLREGQSTFPIISRLVLRTRIVSDSVEEKIKTHILCSITSYSIMLPAMRKCCKMLYCGVGS